MKLREEQVDALGPGACAPCQSGTPDGAPAAAAESGTSPGKSVITVSHDKQAWIGIELVDDAGRPRAGEAYRVELPDGTKVEGRLDANGKARLEGIDPGSCTVTFPERDAKDWKKA